MAFPFFTGDDRESLVLAELDVQNRDISDADRARKYAKMAKSAYRFFRGTAHLYWRDHWNDWRHHRFGGVFDSQTWLQGDAHVYNFGAYGDDRQGVHYGMDDFDDAFIGDYQYDLWRQAISMVLDADENAELSTKKTRRAIRHFLSAYLDTVEDHADGRSADDIHVKYIKKPIGPFMREVLAEEGVAEQLAKWTVMKDGQRVFDTEYKKLAALSASERSELLKALAEEYPATLQPGNIEGRDASHFAVKDVARRVNAGTGSLGVARYYALVQGASDSPDDDIILDIKSQQRPSAYPYMSTADRRKWRKSFKHEAERHAHAFIALADHADEYLGWLTLGDNHFSVRQRSPYKEDFPTDDIEGFKEYRRLSRQWGRILAREHIRGAHALRADDPGCFCRAVTALTGDTREAFKQQVVTLAMDYAEQVRRDHAVFLAHRAGHRD